MPELWLPLEDRLAFWDPLAEQVRVIGWRPGPAGVSSIELAPGLHASVDHASPTTLTEVTIDAADGHIDADTLTLLSHVLGDEATDVVHRLPTTGTQGRPTPIRARRARGGDDGLWLAQLVLTVDLADEAALSDLARAAALLDGVRPAATLGLPLANDLARRGVELLLGAQLHALDPDHRADLEQRLVHVEHLTPGAVTDLDLHRARRHLDDATARTRPTARRAAAAPPAAAAGIAAPAAAKAAAPMEAHDAVQTEAAADDARGRPGTALPVDGDHHSWAWLDRGSNVQFQASRGAAGSWGRVYRAADRLLLGLAPLRTADDADGLKALVVIPHIADPDHLVVDVVDDPTTPRRAVAHDLTRRAVLAGRTAARLSRRGDPSADDAWHDTAQRWRTLGDAQRANLALRHGQRDDERGSPRGRRTTATTLLADEIG
jgi:hypothetical protein